VLVTFRTKAYPNITMFGDPAVRLLKLMGHSGTVPSAMMPEDIPNAVARLEAALTELEPSEASRGDGDAGETDANEPRVTLRQRAYPLIELFEAAADADAAVMWDS
jgi:hypothetical protein